MVFQNHSPVRPTSPSDQRQYVNFLGSSYVNFTTGWNKNGKFAQPFAFQSACSCWLIGTWLNNRKRIPVLDSGLFHALMAIRTERDLASHNKLWASWEG